MVYLVELTEGWVGSKILCAYYSKEDAEEHCNRLENMSTFLDECTYKVIELEVV